MPLARMETTVAINALLDRLPDLHLDPAAPHEHQRRGVPADSLINGDVDAMSADSRVPRFRDQAQPRRARAGDRIAPDSSAGDHGEWPAT